MSLVVVGLSHHNAGVDTRERFAFRTGTLDAALRALAATDAVEEGAIIQTCNRTEVYARVAREPSRTIIDWLHRWHGIEDGRHDECFFSFSGESAVRHMFRVGGGLDSLVLGEPQIGGQVKQAWQAAAAAGTLGPVLGRLFQHAFQCTKRVRTETTVGRHPVTVPYAVMMLAQQIFADLPSSRVLMLGAGEMIGLCARHFRGQRVTDLRILNRSAERADELARQVGATSGGLDAIDANLRWADIIVACTASSEPLISRQALRQAMGARRHRPLLIVDIAVPRDVEAAAERIDDVYLYTIDDLDQVLTANRREREQAAADAEAIVDTEVTAFQQWLGIHEAGAALTEFRRHAEQHAAELLASGRRQLRAGSDPQQVLDQLAERLVHRLLHGPTLKLREQAARGELQQVNALRSLFEDSEDQ